MKNHGYEVNFYQSGRYAVTEQFKTIKAARKAVTDYISEMKKDYRLTGSRGFVRVGSVTRDNKVSIDHKAFGMECCAYIRKRMYSNYDGFYTIEL